ncbi:hypothetical protein EMIT013CA1_10545 [Bacillus sp. IT-13CA1]
MLNGVKIRVEPIIGSKLIITKDNYIMFSNRIMKTKKANFISFKSKRLW